MSGDNDDIWTVQRILQWTTSFLTDKGVEGARLEAELLLAHARKCQRINLYTDLNVPLTDAERALMRECVKRRANREPLSYITGQREFYGRNFYICPGVLVPRHETETLIDVALEHIPAETPSRICEIGFGSGCISVTIAKQRLAVVVDGTDISPTAMSCATQNVKEHELSNRVSLHSGSLFDPLSTITPSPRFDGIVSNPPYIRDGEMDSLQPEVSQHEPREALAAGEDGLDVVRQIVSQAPDWLTETGWIALEVDPAQCAAVVELLRERGFCDNRVQKDLNGDDRIVFGKMSPPAK